MINIPMHFKFVHKLEEDFVYTAFRGAANHYAVMWFDEDLSQELVCMIYSVEEVLDCLDNEIWEIVDVIL